MLAFQPALRLPHLVAQLTCTARAWISRPCQCSVHLARQVCKPHSMRCERLESPHMGTQSCAAAIVRSGGDLMWGSHTS